MRWSDVSDWLLSTYPDDLLVPIKDGTKQPLFPHRNGQWTWSLLETYMKKHRRKKTNDMGILLKTLCVVDVDTRELVTELESRFPILRECPCEDTKKGRHYFFRRSSLCDSVSYMDQRSGVIPKVDFKTRCSTGSAGLIIVAPSKGKKWLRKPWRMGDILRPIPDDLLQAVAVPMQRFESVTLVFPQDNNRRLVYRDSPYIHLFELITEAVKGGHEVPLLIGTAEQMTELIHLCMHRTFSKWPVDVEGIQRLADYLCCRPKVTRWLSSTIPVSPTAWISSLGTVSEEWAKSSCLGNDVFKVTDLILSYEPLPKDSRWLFLGHRPIDLLSGTRMLRKDIRGYAKTTIPDAVLMLMDIFPNVVLAGGAALDLASPHLLAPPSDYDLFVTGATEDEFRCLLQSASDVLQAKVAAQTGNAVTFLTKGNTSIQIILRRFDSIAHVLQTFDIGPCQVAYHDNELWATRLWIECMRRMAFYVNFWNWSNASVSRIFKYYTKGFEIFVPALQREMFTRRDTPTTGVVNLFVIEAECHLEWSFKRYREGQPKLRPRVTAQKIQDKVRRYNYWGQRYQSGYESFLGTSRLLYVLKAMISKGLVWVGLRPVRQVENIEIEFCAIPEAGREAFHSTPPNFPALYQLDDQV